MKIDDEKAAIRLARAIISDVLLYGGKVEDFNEGRALFMKSVAESLYPLFDEVLGDPTWSPGREDRATGIGAPRAVRRRESALPPARIEPAEFERPRHKAGGTSHWPVVFFAAGFVALIVAALLLFLATRAS